MKREARMNLPPEPLTKHFRRPLSRMNNVVLQSSSGARYPVSRQVAALSATISAMCEGSDTLHSLRCWV